MKRSRGWKSRTPRLSSRKKIFLFVFLLVLLFSMQSFVYIEKNIRPPLMNLAKIRLKQVATEAINSAITDQISRSTDYKKLIDWRTDHNGKVNGFVLNYAEHMRITADAIHIVQNSLNRLKSMPDKIPLGEAFNSAILASFGPDIPIRLQPLGAVQVNLNTRYQNAGINMILVEVYMHIVTHVTIVIPFHTEPEMVETELPISYVLVVGDVPTYYFDNQGNPVGNYAGQSPGISLPNVAIPPMEKNDSTGNTPPTEEKAH